MDPTQAVLEHPYAWLGPLVVMEGPAVTLTAGSLVGAGLARFWPVWAIVVLAEVAGDSLLYLTGRAARHPRAAALLTRLGMTGRRRDRFTAAVHRSLPRMVLTAKAADVLAVPSFVAAGLARIPYRRFAAWVTAGAAARAALLIGLGALLGGRLTGLLGLPGGLVLLTATVTVPVVLVQFVIRRHHRRTEGEPCASSSAPTRTPPTSTAPRPSPSASPRP